MMPVVIKTLLTVRLSRPLEDWIVTRDLLVHFPGVSIDTIIRNSYLFDLILALSFHGYCRRLF